MEWLSAHKNADSHSRLIFSASDLPNSGASVHVSDKP